MVEPLTRSIFDRLMSMATRTHERTQLATLRSAYNRAFVRLARDAGSEAAMRSYLRARNLMATYLLQHRRRTPLAKAS